MTEHIDEAAALAVVALPDLDPQRVAALAHAERCERCATLLAESADLLCLIDEVRPARPVSRGLKERVERAVWQQPKWSPSWYWLLSLLGIASLGLALVDGH